MASGVAHDLNQYLGLVAGHAELALYELDDSGPAQAGLRDSLRIVVKAAMDGAETVKRLQTFARPRQEGPADRLDVGELLREVAKLTAPRWRDAAQAQARPISLHVETDGELFILGWPESLREALTNLVFNAVDALPHGGTVRLAGRRRGTRIEVEVADSGIGMSPEVRARIFEPFFTTTGDRGTGLGLAMVFGIVERHGGEISVDSAPGRGTTFRLLLPATDAGQPIERAPQPIEQVPGLRILAVDDEPSLGQMIARMLTPEGHAVVVATSGEEAMERLATMPFDLVISDVGMGEGMNGWELADRVRAAHPELRFLLATGWGAEIDPEEARASGVAGVIAKPYRVADLRRLIATTTSAAA
jgi:CheY-like chemotaxis protein